jgi:hypothetical protein
MVSISAFMFANYTIGLNVYYNDKVVGCVAAQQDFKLMIDRFETEISSEIGKNYSTDFNFYYEFSLVKKDEIGNIENLKERLLPECKDLGKMTVLTINGETIGVNKDGGAINEMLDRIKQNYSTGTRPSGLSSWRGPRRAEAVPPGGRSSPQNHRRLSVYAR